jgi:nicotinamide mononucleotide transporter
MGDILDFFSIKKIAFTVLNYPMSYVELFGTVFNLWAVYLIARRRILTWPVGLVGVVLFMAMFYQYQYYADTIEQGYYFLTGIWGWYAWSRTPPEEQEADVVRDVRFSERSEIVPVAVGTLAVGLLAGYATANLHLWFPVAFPQPASFPHLDALTTVMSFTAQWLMIRKRTESWVYWILVDVIAIGLYWVKGMKLVTLLYVLFTVLAVRGLLEWRRARADADAPESVGKD